MGATVVANRIWLDVPFSEKDEAKAAGARWDPAAKRWYAPSAGVAGLDRWSALPDLPNVLPREDRTFGAGLFVDLVPSSCWFTNVRSCVSQRDWERLRRMLVGRAGRRCEICGRGEDRDTKRWLEAHERWFYDERHLVQTLRRLITLCSDCHRVTHFGLAQVQGRDAEALRHLCAVTNMTPEQAHAHIDQAFQLWQKRSQRTWTLDLSMLTDIGVTLAKPPSATARPGIAERTLNG